MKSLRRLAGHSPWAVAVGCALGLTPPAGTQPPAKPAAVSQAKDGDAINIQVAWLADPGLFNCSLVCRPIGEGLELAGYVPSEPVRQRALHIARSLTDAKLVDHLRVQNGMPITIIRPAAPAELAPQASAVLAESLGEKVLGLRVVCPAPGRVEVAGTVPTPEDKLLVSKCLKKLDGCTRVVNKVSAPLSSESAAVVASVPLVDSMPKNALAPTGSPAPVAVAVVPPTQRPVQPRPPARPPTSPPAVAAEPLAARKNWEQPTTGTRPKPASPALQPSDAPAEVVKAADPPSPRLTGPIVVPPAANLTAAPEPPKPMLTGPAPAMAVVAEPHPSPTTAALPPVPPKPTDEPKTPSQAVVSWPEDKPIGPAKPKSTEVVQATAKSTPAKTASPKLETAKSKVADVVKALAKPVLPKPDLPKTKSDPSKPKADEVVQSPSKLVPPTTDLAKPKTEDVVQAPVLPPPPRPELPKPALPMPVMTVVPAAADQSKLPEPVNPAAAPSPLPKPVEPIIVVRSPEPPKPVVEPVIFAMVGNPPELSKTDLVPTELPRLAPVKPFEPAPLVVAQPKIVVVTNPPDLAATDLVPCDMPQVKSPEPVVVTAPPAEPPVLPTLPVPVLPELPTPVVAAAPAVEPAADLPAPKALPAQGPELPKQLPVSVDVPSVVIVGNPPDICPADLNQPALPSPKPPVVAVKTEHKVINLAPSAMAAAPVPAAPQPATKITRPQVINFTPAKTAAALPAVVANPPAIKPVDLIPEGTRAVTVTASPKRIDFPVAPRQAETARATEPAKPMVTYEPSKPAPSAVRPVSMSVKAEPVTPPDDVIKGILRQSNRGESAGPALDADTVRRAVEDICRANSTDLRLVPTTGRQLNLTLRVRGRADWDKLCKEIKSLPEVAGYAVIYTVSVGGTGNLAGETPPAESAPLTGVIRSGMSAPAAGPDAVRSAIEGLCTGRCDELTVRPNARQQVAVSLKVRSNAEWDRLCKELKALPEASGYAVIYNVIIK